ncbi:MAG: histidinol dehydrogenase [Pseudomonadota bacterium]|nr:histidinol dehydrogenase [Pseudomonadota bacterium]
MIKLVDWSLSDANTKDSALLRNKAVEDMQLAKDVAGIIQEVALRGDAALFACAEKFDKVKLESLVVTDDEYSVLDTFDEKYKLAIQAAYKNIYDYHSKSVPAEFGYAQNEIWLGKQYRPIDKVGLYIPGGTATLVSTLMMLAIPANIAGCKTKVLVTPPMQNGNIAPAILFAAKYCGIDTVYKVGGAQAIAALAYGTETIPKVHKIFGPGNKYVTEAKLQVSNSKIAQVAIDMPAGPSEVLVIGDATANPEFIASDLLAQAEHDVDAQVILVTVSRELASKVLVHLQLQLEYLSRKNVIKQSLSKSSIIITDTLEECFNISNLYAPEHLILHIKNADDYLDKIHNAGSVFVGEWTPEALGDYASGTNHVLPTYGYANMYSGLDVGSFMKAISFQKATPNGLLAIGNTVERLAELEGLDAHKNAVSIRLQGL